MADYAGSAVDSDDLKSTPDYSCERSPEVGSSIIAGAVSNENPIREFPSMPREAD